MIVRDVAGPVLIRRYAWMARLKFIMVKSNSQFGVDVVNTGVGKCQNASTESDRVNRNA